MRSQFNTPQGTGLALTLAVILLLYSIEEANGQRYDTSLESNMFITTYSVGVLEIFMVA